MQFLWDERCHLAGARACDRPRAEDGGHVASALGQGSLGAATVIACAATTVCVADGGGSVTASGPARGSGGRLEAKRHRLACPWPIPVECWQDHTHSGDPEGL
ncbi:MAG: hypothetical protein AABZ70_15240 [candidate division NC10 bacterium]